MLNKLYIVWDKIIPIQFKWIPSEPHFVVRALPVYTDAQDMKLAVRRCLIHSSATDPTNEGNKNANWHTHHFSSFTTDRDTLQDLNMLNT